MTAPARTINSKQDRSMLCKIVKFWPYHPNFIAEIEIHQTRQCFFSLLLSGFVELMWIVSSVSCSPSASRLGMLCAVVMPVYLINCCLPNTSKRSGHSPLCSGINKAFSTKGLSLTQSFLFFRFSVNPRAGCRSGISDILRWLVPWWRLPFRSPWNQGDRKSDFFPILKFGEVQNQFVNLLVITSNTVHMFLI